jgi:hypothetical protein
MKNESFFNKRMQMPREESRWRWMGIYRALPRI